jgi:hypothetical protein
MDMQDKEFDQLFNSKLNDFEVEPSANVWQNIAREMEGKKAKRSIVPYLSVAASVIVVAAVSLLFYNKTAEKPDQPVKIVKVKPIKPLSATDTNAAPVVIDRVEDDTYLKTAAVAAAKVRKTSPVDKSQQAQPMEQEIALVSPEPITQSPETLLSVVPVEKPAFLQSAASVSNVDLNMTAVVNQPKNAVSAPIERFIDPVFENMNSKKRARGLGGLVNKIVAAVDKREDKLIEFTDADNDEGARVTGVNLGFFKIKKQ